MIRHIVLVQVSGTSDPDENTAVFNGIRNIALATEGCLAFAGGANLTPGGLNQGFSHAFTIDFINAAARDAYLANLDMDGIGKRLADLSESGLGGILVMNIGLSAEAIAGDPLVAANPQSGKLEAKWG